MQQFEPIFDRRFWRRGKNMHRKAFSKAISKNRCYKVPETIQENRVKEIEISNAVSIYVRAGRNGD